MTITKTLVTTFNDPSLSFDGGRGDEFITGGTIAKLDFTNTFCNPGQDTSSFFDMSPNAGTTTKWGQGGGTWSFDADYGLYSPNDGNRSVDVDIPDGFEDDHEYLVGVWYKPDAAFPSYGQWAILRIGDSSVTSEDPDNSSYTHLSIEHNIGALTFWIAGQSSLQVRMFELGEMVQIGLHLKPLLASGQMRVDVYIDGLFYSEIVLPFTGFSTITGTHFSLFRDQGNSRTRTFGHIRGGFFEDVTVSGIDPAFWMKAQHDAVMAEIS